MDVGSSDAKAQDLRRRRKDPTDSRAERKRELDRIAQRATRERTKNRIADLEQRLASLESGDKNGEIAQLTKTIGELRSENGRYQNALVKMRFAISEALSENEATRRDSSSTASQVGPDNIVFANEQVNGLNEHTQLNETYPAGEVVPVSNHTPTMISQRLQNLYQTSGFRPPTPDDFANFDISSIYEFFEYGSGQPFANPSPLNLRMPSSSSYVSIAPDEQKWKTSDDAFHQGLAAPVMNMSFDEGSLARALLLGWESLGSEGSHPMLMTLRCVDQRVFGKWTSRPQRLALMYICGCQMRWRTHPSEENRMKVPHWFLPRPAQDRIQHPLVIDFLVWPGLRERLVFEYEKYTRTGEFSFAFVEFFNFYWPFSDEQTAQYDPATGMICGLSKIFKDYVYDLKNWTMLPEFFARFPEMRADIEMFDESAPRAIQYQKSWT